MSKSIFCSFISLFLDFFLKSFKKKSDCVFLIKKILMTREISNYFFNRFNHQPPKCGVYQKAICIIICIGFLLAAVIKDSANVNAMGVGNLLLIIGIVNHQQKLGTIKEIFSQYYKNCKKIVDRSDVRTKVDTQRWVYGPEAWRIWNVKVFDLIPKPNIGNRIPNTILFYMPHEIEVRGSKQILTLNVLKKIIPSHLFAYFDTDVLCKYGDHAIYGWFLIDKDVLQSSLGKTYAAQEALVHDQGGSMAPLNVIIAFILMVFEYTGEKLYSKDVYTRCYEKMHTETCICVGNFGYKGLYVFASKWSSSEYGTTSVQKVIT